MSTPKTTETPMFSRVEAGQVLVSIRGFHRQADLYERGGELFASLKDGFVRLLASENTTAPNIRWKAIEGVRFVRDYNGPKLIPVPLAEPSLKKLRAVK